METIQITVNGKDQEIPTAFDLCQVLLAFNIDPQTKKGFAVALNGNVIPKNELQSTTLAEKDRIEIIHPIGGG